MPRRLEQILQYVDPQHHDTVRAIGIELIEEKEQALRQSAEAVKKSEERFANIIENFGAVLWMTNTEKSLMEYVSPAYEDIWGRAVDELYRDASTWLDAIHPEDRERVLRELPKQRTGEYDTFYRITRPDGTVRWIHDKAFPIIEDGGTVQRVTGIAMDVTEQRNLEQQARQKQKMEAIGQIAGGVAHEFNNILTAITGYAELAREETGTEQQHDIDEILKASDRAKKLTKALLLYSKKDLNRKRDTFELNAVTKDLEGMLRPVIGENRQIVSTYASSGLVQMESEDYTQIVLNLVVNARDAMPQGGVITIATGSATIDAMRGRQLGIEPGAYETIAVKDTGCGIPEDIREHVFEPFFTTKDDGTGIGLATVHGIVQKNKGGISLESAVGKGTSFIVYLPRYEGPIDEHTSAKPFVNNTAKRRILVIEDEETIRKVVRRALESNGYEVYSAANGTEAIDIARRSPLDSLLSDIILPGKHGPEIVNDIRTIHPNIPVVYMTGYASEDAVKQAGVDLRGERVIGKPFEIAKLLEAIESVAKPAYTQQ